MRRVLVWTDADVRGLADAWGVSRILTEIDERGLVTRELGFDAAGELIHRHSGKTTLTTHGIFDAAVIGAGRQSELRPEQLERAWSA